jgi:hypothetical protein
MGRQASVVEGDLRRVSTAALISRTKESRRCQSMSAKGPLRKDGILSRKLGDEWMLYDPAAGAVHIINGTAEFVWNLCDGQHDLDDIAGQLRGAYQVPDGTALTKDINDIVQGFSDKGLLHASGN